MPKTITISDRLFSRLEAFARPFIDHSPEDVIVRLLDETGKKDEASFSKAHPDSGKTKLEDRAPRERGAVVELNGEKISADTVPDLCIKIMQYLDSKELWGKVEELAPYKTSSKRYLFSKTAIHPNGKEFFVPVKYKDLIIEAHKNYLTTINQFNRFLRRLGVALIYKGT